MPDTLTASFRPSEALRRTGSSATITITQRARDMRAAGLDVISLSAGQPDFNTPAHIGEAAAEAIRRGETRYPPVAGIPELRSAIAAKFRRENGLEYQANETIVSTGGKQVIANALLATLGPGDEVVIPTPSWVSYPQLTTYCGATPVLVPGDPRHQYKVSPETVAAAITPRTRWIILNTPNNPTGAVYSAAELAALAEVLERHPQVWILTDDMYEHLRYDDIPFATMAQVAPELKERTLTMNGVSKAYAMTGWRIGYGAGPRPLIAAMEKLQTQITSGACSIAQWAAVAALRGPQDYVSRSREVFDRRRKSVVARLRSIPGMTCDMPGGAFYVYPSCTGYIGRTTPAGRRIETDEDFVMALLSEARVATVHGAAFGGTDSFRISYAAADEELMRGCDRIAEFCASLR
ncbi:aspartate aminotransferase [Haematobacter missouriensis]|nr:pyridoxal phosphate-dependent aminotransferase [Haematobacter missouriensis]KFI32474.1 aspartate aminotransferase [Haematobacter missouriensis]